MDFSLTNQELINILIAVVGLLTAAVIYLGVKIYYPQRKCKGVSQGNSTLNRLELEEFDPDEVLESCFIHPDDPPIGSCCICHKALCKKCWREAEDLHFCPEHLKVYLATEWQKFTEIRTGPETTEESLVLFKFKKDLWEGNQLPTFVVTHYQIDFKNDVIESLIQFFIPKENIQDVTLKFESDSKLNDNIKKKASH